VTIVKLAGEARGGGAEFVVAADMAFAATRREHRLLTVIKDLACGDYASAEEFLRAYSPADLRQFARVDPGGPVATSPWRPLGDLRTGNG